MKLYNLLYEDFEELYLGYSALMIILSSCIASVAAMTILINGHDLVQMIQLFVVVVVAMGYNTAVLAQMKPKFVFNSLLVSLGVCTILAIVNIGAIL